MKEEMRAAWFTISVNNYVISSENDFEVNVKALIFPRGRGSTWEVKEDGTQCDLTADAFPILDKHLSLLILCGALFSSLF